MGVIAKFTLQLFAVVIILALGIFFPNALAETLAWLDATLAALAENAEPSGTLKLIFQFAGAGFVALMAITVIGIGFTMRQFVSQTFFRWRHIVTAGLIPLLAHAVKWGLGLSWPALLVPVQQVADQLISWFAPATQVTLGLFQARDHLMTIIISLALVLLWSLTTFMWRQFRGRKASAPSPSPQTPTGKKWSDSMKTILYRGWRLVTLPFRLVQKLLDLIPDIVLGPIPWFIIQIGLAVGVAFLLTEGLERVLTSLSAPNPLQNFPHRWIWIIFTILFCLPRWKKVEETEGENTVTLWRLDIFEVAIAGRGAQLTWFGMVSPFILATGKYPFLGERFGFAWLKVESETIAEDGYLIIGDITFPVWQSPNAGDGTKERSTITLQAGNGGTVSGNLAFVMRGLRRIKWEIAGNAGLQLGNRGRQELQELIERFNDTDVKSLQPVMSKLFGGATMVTCMMPDDVVGRKARSIVRDVNNKPMYVFVGDVVKEGSMTKVIKTEEEAQLHLLWLLEQVGDKKSLTALKQVAGGTINTTTIKADHPVEDVVNFLGHDLIEVTYDTVLNSKEVEDASNRASSEEKQREAQLASARTNREVRQELLPSDEEKKDPHYEQSYELRTILAAAQDNPEAARVVLLAGGANDLTRAVAGANLVNNNGTKK